MHVWFGKFEVAKKRVGHCGVVVLSGVDHERMELRWTAFHRGDNRRHLHKIRPRANDVDYFEHLFGYQNVLQSNNARFTVTPQFAVQRVARVNNERRETADAFVVDLAVVRHDDDAIRCFQVVIR